MELSNSVATKPPLGKEILVALLVGSFLGAIVGWFVGTFATFFATLVAIDSANVTRGMRTSAFFGGLIGIPLGAVTGIVVSLPIRLLSVRFFRLLKNPWLAAPLGAALGWCFAILILERWYPSVGAAVYVVMHSMAVGAVVAAVTVLAKPKWL